MTSTGRLEGTCGGRLVQTSAQSRATLLIELLLCYCVPSLVRVKRGWNEAPADGFVLSSPGLTLRKVKASAKNPLVLLAVLLGPSRSPTDLLLVFSSQLSNN